MYTFTYGENSISIHDVYINDWIYIAAVLGAHEPIYM